VKRWQDAGNVYESGFWGSLHNKNNQVIFSSKTAVKDGEILRLDEPKDVDLKPGGSHLWCRCGVRFPAFGAQETSVYERGVYSHGGIANACQAADELIWIFDQYFFSRPFARLLNHLIRNDTKKKLCVILVLPPYADDHPHEEHHARKLALNDLTAGLMPGSGKFERVSVV